ncbi:MAG: hypothetical protein ACI9H8_002223 [Lysobacterales bacterium]|jgi:hypothetical protein
MEFEGTTKDFGEVDSQPLIDAILARDESDWAAQQYRQNAYSVHEYTQSLVMVFCSGWPELNVTKEPSWDLLKDTAVPLMHHIIETFYPPGGTIIRAMAAKLVAGGIISPHRDTHQSFVNAHRIHIPVTTNPGVRFMIDGRPHRLKVGQAYEINNQKNHSVMNNGKEDRITFIFDYLPLSHMPQV